MLKNKFIFRFWPSAISLVLFVTLLGLGTWQLHRLEWKDNLIAEIAARQLDAPLDISSQQTCDDSFSYRPASATGLFQHDHELFLHAISKEGAGGYHVLTPMQMEDGRFLLVDRGFIPFDKREPASRQAGRIAGEVTVHGLLRYPDAPHWFQPANDPKQNDWYGFDLGAMASAAQIGTFFPCVLAADDAPNVGGWPEGGQTRLTLDNPHLGYTITWYSLALVLLVIYLLSSWQRKKKK